MPRLSVIAIRAALVYLLLGFTFGALMLANKGIPFAPWLWNLLPSHVDFLLVGWTAQLILGVAFWILPRFSGGSRGNVRLAAAAILLLNAGVLLSAVQTVAPQIPWLAPLGRVLQITAGVVFSLHAWGRVRPTY